MTVGGPLPQPSLAPPTDRSGPPAMSDAAAATVAPGPRDTALEGLLLRAALLAGQGPQAQPLARSYAALAGAGAGRSCLDAGSPLQLTIDAPGRVQLRAGLRLDETREPSALRRPLAAALAAARHPQARQAAEGITETIARLPPAAHPSLGSWVFVTAGDAPSPGDVARPGRATLYLDLRDPAPGAALTRLRALLDSAQLDRLGHWQQALPLARPWVLQWQPPATPGAIPRAHLHWLLERSVTPEQALAAVAPGAWPSVVGAYAQLLRRPTRSGRWTIATPLDAGRDLRVGSTGWSLAPEDDEKHRAVGTLVAAHGGARDAAQALWSLCRGAAPVGWRVGRACELKLDEGRVVRLRLFLAPQSPKASG